MALNSNTHNHQHYFHIKMSWKRGRSTGVYLLNGRFSRATWANRHQKGHTNLNFNEARVVGGWQWHQLDHMQIISISLPADKHASTSSLNVLEARRCSWCPSAV